MLEQRLLGYGNVGRNTTIVRSNYLLPENHYFYEDSLRRWETLSRDLNYNVMYSPRGVVDLALSDGDVYKRQQCAGPALYAALQPMTRAKSLSGCGAPWPVCKYCRRLTSTAQRAGVETANAVLPRRSQTIRDLSLIHI